MVNIIFCVCVNNEYQAFPWGRGDVAKWQCFTTLQSLVGLHTCACTLCSLISMQPLFYIEHEFSPYSLHGIGDILQLVRSRYQLPSFDVPIENVYTSPDLLQAVKAPGFQFNLLQEDIVSCFIAGKPLICIEPSSVLRTPFKFRQPSSSVAEAGHTAEWVKCIYVSILDIKYDYMDIYIYMSTAVLLGQFWTWMISLRTFLTHSRWDS